MLPCSVSLIALVSLSLEVLYYFHWTIVWLVWERNAVNLCKSQRLSMNRGVHDGAWLLLLPMNVLFDSQRSLPHSLTHLDHRRRPNRFDRKLYWCALRTAALWIAPNSHATRCTALDVASPFVAAADGAAADGAGHRKLLRALWKSLGYRKCANSFQSCSRRQPAQPSISANPL